MYFSWSRLGSFRLQAAPTRTGSGTRTGDGMGSPAADVEGARRSGLSCVETVESPVPPPRHRHPNCVDSAPAQPSESPHGGAGKGACALPREGARRTTVLVPPRGYPRCDARPQCCAPPRRSNLRHTFQLRSERGGCAVHLRTLDGASSGHRCAVTSSRPPSREARLPYPLHSRVLVAAVNPPPNRKGTSVGCTAGLDHEPTALFHVERNLSLAAAGSIARMVG